ncbi:MAG: hypothetical protein ACRD2K_06125 [Terriglobales bacterium]
MKYVVLFCLIVGLAGCFLAGVLPDKGMPPNFRGTMVLGGMSWVFIGVFLGLVYKFVKWMGRS